MMSPDSNDLSPRLSMRDIGDSLSSLSFDRSRDMGAGFASVSGSPTAATTSAMGSVSGSPTPQSPTVMTMSIREEDLWLLSDTLEQALEGADETLQGLESDRALLPCAILRKCEEFADGLGSLASELEGQSLEERRRLAEAIRDDLKLFEEVEGDWERLPSNQTRKTQLDQTMEGEDRIGDVRDDEIARALSGASVLLRDVESAFRDIGKDEAEEIADAALIMARLFLLSLQNIHSNLLEQLTTTTPSDSPHNFKNMKSDEAGSHRDHGRSTVWIEELPSDDGNENNNDNSNNNDNDGADQKKNPSQPRQGRTSQKKKSIHAQRRMRVLWPPLGPKVDTAMAWTKEEATKRPFLAVALGLTLWPVAISTALVGSSAVLLDGALQTTYERFREGPWISVVEEGAAQAYQAGRLTLATGKLVGKQSLRVASRQIERRGGLQPVLHDLGGMALDRIAHPIDTMGKIWDGVHWGFGVVKEATDDFLMMRRESQDSLI